MEREIDTNTTYRIDESYNAVYQYDADARAFLFFCKLNLLTDEEKEIIENHLE